MWADWFKRNATKVIDFLTRQRNLGLKLCALSASLLLFGAGGVFFEIEYEGNRFKWGLTDEPNLLLATVVIVLGAVGFIIGLIIVTRVHGQEHKLSEIGRVIVVELRGLVDTSDRPLISAIPAKFVGQRIDLVKDVRKFLTGDSAHLGAALIELDYLRRDLQVARGDVSREHVTVIVGGVLQVPLLFHVGTLIDDEGNVVLFDWNRTEGRWNELMVEENKEAFVLEEDEFNLANEVVLAVSASYLVDIDGIKRTFADKPLVHLRLQNPLPNTIWGVQWQNALTQQFLQTVARLGNKRVSIIHLVLAAPASLAIRFGRAYDLRNMPLLRCYQYEKESNPSYPWSIQMATASKPAQRVATQDF
ncbi:SAVED domain-containing protein [Oxalicibacterium faecigallinarum]|uniref:SAVED domain-containing protein n=1 Tax=Oxalicibacterium faecigallinarum TaxID=573741 RepID=A0A8J3F2E1_9BURK|nr:SAVED domain-containing protein [Oxalicibacterium faecigallinarum]GGI17626.1 hypothetical protein GCM10008066_09920 [Oxalicibacterium faecigallinarum]